MGHWLDTEPHRDLPTRPLVDQGRLEPLPIGRPLAVDWIGSPLAGLDPMPVLQHGAAAGVGFAIQPTSANDLSIDGSASQPMRPGKTIDAIPNSQSMGVLALPPESSGDGPPAFGTKRIGNYVWVDENANGLQDESEPGLGGVIVELVRQDVPGNVGAMTDNDGYYKLEDVASGRYRMHFFLSNGFTFTTPYAGDFNFDSNADSAGWTEDIIIDELATADDSYDAGLLSSISVGDRVWHDSNTDGIQDVAEPGIPGITVDLLDELQVVIQSTITDGTGRYRFNGLDSEVFYQIHIHVPSTFEVTRPFVGPDDSDSDVEPDGRSPWFTLEHGDVYLNLDAGLVNHAPASVGDFVWLDDNRNGIQDANEAGVSGIFVQLRDGDGVTIASTTTDIDGYYQFSGLVPNADYTIHFERPEGYVFTDRHAGSPDEDSDADPFGDIAPFRVGAGMTDLLLDAGLALEEADPQVAIQFVNASGYFKDKLRVAKWEHAFQVNGGVITVRQNFIRRDPDRFYVYVVDPAANVNPNVKDIVRVRLNTTMDQGNDTILEETGVNTGRFWSSWLLLTSVRIDDEYQANEIADNTENDPPFFVKLGDTVTATYGASKAEATVPVEKIVKLHINILRDKKAADGGQPVLTQQQIEADVIWANAIFAPVGIRFDATFQIVDPPTGVDFSNGFDVYPPRLDANGKIQITDEEKALLGASDIRTAGTDDIEIYYVLPMTGRFGESFWASAVPDSKYADSVVVGQDRTYRTLAHEIGHILLDDGDHAVARGEQIVNLMTRNLVLRNDVSDCRRIFAQQGRNMLVKRPNLLANP
jgi:hypothetical protein